MVSKKWCKEAADILGMKIVEGKQRGLPHKYWLVRKTSTGESVKHPFMTLSDMQYFLETKIKRAIGR